MRDKESTIVASSDRALTFSGKPTMAIPSGAVLVSDPIDVAVPAIGDLAIDLYLPGSTNTPSPLTTFTSALQTSYVSETGNFAGKSPFPVVARTPGWFVISRVEVLAPQSGRRGCGGWRFDYRRLTIDRGHEQPLLESSRPAAGDAADADGGAQRGHRRKSLCSPKGAFNGRDQRRWAGSSATCWRQPAITHAIVLEGINDIGNARENPTPTAEDLIAAHKQLIERAHTRGIVIFGATLTPFEGAMYSRRSAKPSARR